MDITSFKLEVVYHQPSALHVQDLHACTWLVDKNESISILNVALHLVCNDAAECIETLAHISRMRIEVEPVCIIEAEHRLPPRHNELAQSLWVDIAGKSDLHTVWINNLTNRLEASAIATYKAIAAHDGNLAASVVDTDREELTGSFRRFQSNLCLPVIEPAFHDTFVGTKLPNRLAALQEPLVDGHKIVNLPHNFVES